MLTPMQNLYLSLFMLIYSSVSFLLFPNGVTGGAAENLPIKYSFVIYIFYILSILCIL